MFLVGAYRSVASLMVFKGVAARTIVNKLLLVILFEEVEATTFFALSK